MNKKLAGKFKDEKNGNPLIEFVGLRAKMYATRDVSTGEAKKNVQNNTRPRSQNNNDMEWIIA